MQRKKLGLVFQAVGGRVMNGHKKKGKIKKREILGVRNNLGGGSDRINIISCFTKVVWCSAVKQ